jgi:excisionase family DNA binding protein
MAQLPAFLTVEEAASILRIGRTVAYEQTRRYEETEGREGIPVIRVGRLMRVPRAALERWNGAPLDHSEPAPPPPTSSNGLHDPVKKPRRKPRLAQEVLPFKGQ